MKLTVFLLTVTLIQVHANSNAQTVTISGKDLSFKQIFSAIEKQTGFVVLANKDVAEHHKRLSLTVYNMLVPELLDIVLKDQPFRYMIEGKTIFLSKKVTAPSNVVALQQTTELPPVKIRVTDVNGQPLSGASVTNKKSRNSGITNIDGLISLNVSTGDMLTISYVGFEPQSVIIRDVSTAVNIVLKKSESKLDEIQVIGYGTTSRRFSTGNVSTVKAADIEKQPINNPLLALQGRVAGVEINQVNGISGSAVKINIRGVNSLAQGTDPLYVVDGVPYNSSMFNTSGYGGINGGMFGSSSEYNIGPNPLSLINPSDIESIDVLKDADATAIYGSRAANGVILITTKKGRIGKTMVELNLQQGLGKITRKARLMNTQQYLMMRREAFNNDGATPDAVNAKDLTLWDQNAFTDWQDIMIGGTAKYSDARLNFSGGSQGTQFNLSGNFNRQTTVFPGDWADTKGMLHFSLNHQRPGQRLKLNLTASYVHGKNETPSTDYTQYITIAPNAPSLFQADGSFNWDDFPYNPLRDKEVLYTGVSNNLLANVLIGYKLINGLEARISMGYNSLILDEHRASPITSNMPNSGITTGGATFNNNNMRSIIAEPQLEYKSEIGNGSFSGLIGGTLQRRYIDGQVIYADGYTDDGMLGSMAGAANIGKGQTVNEEYRYASVFGRLNYTWNDRYIITLNGRRDGSSRFGPGKQYGNFGAIGTAWLFSEERFMQNQSLISFGKLRMSYGTVGKEPGRNYAFLELFDFTFNFPYGGQQGMRPANLFAPDYRWEINRKSEVGLELGLLKDRINLSISYFLNRSSNQLINRPLQSSVGFSGVIANLPATIQNNGLEFVFNTKNIDKKGFKWNTSFNVSIQRNKMVSFPNLATSSYAHVYFIGKPVYLKRIYSYAGLNPNSGTYQFYNAKGEIITNPSIPGDWLETVDPKPRYFGGITNSLSYKGLYLDFTLQFIKQTGENYLMRNDYPPGMFGPLYGTGNQTTDALDRWTPATPNAKFQKYSQNGSLADLYNSAGSSSLTFTDASFIRLKNIALTYVFPSRITQRLHLESLKVFTHGQNMLTFTRYKGIDPETQDLKALPPLRIFTLGFQVIL